MSERWACLLLDEHRQRPAPRRTADRIRRHRVAGRDHHTAPGVQGVGQIVAEPPVLPCGHTCRAALADATFVDGPTGRVGGPLPSAAGALTEQGRLVDVDLAYSRRSVRVTHHAVVLVPDNRGISA